jgi:hypothetical protein
MSRADVLGGQLAEASGQPAEPSARVGLLEETLAADGPDVVLTSSFGAEILRLCCCSRLGRASPKVVLTPRVLLLPSIEVRTCRIGLSCSVRMFSAAAEAQTYCRCVVKLHFFFPLLRVSRFICR